MAIILTQTEPFVDWPSAPIGLKKGFPSSLYAAQLHLVHPLTANFKWRGEDLSLKRLIRNRLPAQLASAARQRAN